MVLGWRDLVKCEAKERIYPHDRKPLPWVKVQSLQCEVILLISSMVLTPKKGAARITSGCSMKLLSAAPPF